MLRASIICLILVLGGAGVLAQRGDVQSAYTSLVSEQYRTKNGTTMPHPGVTQGEGNTPLDRTIERKDDKVMRSICSNCL